MWLIVKTSRSVLISLIFEKSPYLGAYTKWSHFGEKQQDWCPGKRRRNSFFTNEKPKTLSLFVGIIWLTSGCCVGLVVAAVGVVVEVAASTVSQYKPMDRIGDLWLHPLFLPVITWVLLPSPPPLQWKVEFQHADTLQIKCCSDRLLCRCKSRRACLNT